MNGIVYSVREYRSARSVVRYSIGWNMTRQFDLVRKRPLDQFAERTGCSLWWPNRHRMLLGGLACVLPEQIRRGALQGMRLSRAWVGAIRLKLLPFLTETRSRHGVRICLARTTGRGLDQGSRDPLLTCR